MKCIYSIINLLNGKLYIGSTCNFARRKSEHLSMLRRGVHKSHHLQKAFNKYGEENFKFIILEKLDINQNLYEIEQLYLDKYKSYDKKIGYNLAKYANEPNNDSTKKIVYQLDLKGNLLNKFNSLAEAAKCVNIHYSAISSCCNEKTSISKNYIWMFKKDFSEINLKNRIKSIKSKSHSENTKNKLKEIALKKRHNNKAIIQFDKYNNIIKEFNSVRQASLETNCNQESISGLCSGKYKNNRKGFIFKYKEQC